MTGRHTIEKICRELSCAEGDVWRHQIHRDVAARRDTSTLARFLYTVYFLGTPTLWNKPERGLFTNIEKIEDAQLAAQFLSKIQPPIYRCSGWHILEETGSNCIVERNGVKLLLKPDEWEKEPRTTDRAVVLMPRTRQYASPGFLAACSEAGPLDREASVVRIYVNASKASATAAFLVLLNWASRIGMPGVVKAVNHTEGYARRDTVVAYFPGDLCRTRLTEFNDVLAPVKLRRACPAFAEQLAPGLSWAESPGTSMSFGMHRCTLIAQALADAPRTASAAERKQAVLAAWKAFGLNVEKPHLNPGPLI